MVKMPHCGSSMVIFGVIRSQPKKAERIRETNGEDVKIRRVWWKERTNIKRRRLISLIN